MMKVLSIVGELQCLQLLIVAEQTDHLSIVVDNVVLNFDSVCQVLDVGKGVVEFGISGFGLKEIEQTQYE